MSRSRTRFAAALVFGLAFLISGTRGTSASETLASADFDGDSVGDHAINAGTPTVSEAVYDDSDTSGGWSEVAYYGTGKRYRLSDAGTSGGRRGIRAPLSRTVSSGTLVASAVVTAGQTGDGGVLCVSDPADPEWLGMVKFGADGKFNVHGSATTASYTVGDRYQVVITVAFGTDGHVDYAITDLTTSSSVLTSSGHSLASGAEAGSVKFSTGTTDDGGYTIDDILATL